MTMTATARTVKYVELGVNRSAFRNESCTPGYGVSVGFGMDYYPWQKFGGFWGWGLGFQNKKIIAKDRIWGSEYNQMNSDFTKGDIYVNIQYIEFPIQIGYSIKFNEFTTLTFLSGICLQFPVENESTVKNRHRIKLEKNANGKYEYDYTLVDESGIGYPHNFYWGCKFSYTRYFLSIRYIHALIESGDTLSISINDEIDSFIISFGYNF